MEFHEDIDLMPIGLFSVQIQYFLKVALHYIQQHLRIRKTRMDTSIKMYSLLYTRLITCYVRFSRTSQIDQQTRDAPIATI